MWPRSLVVIACVLVAIAMLLPTAGRADFVTPYQSTTDEVPLAGLNITSNAVVAVPGGFSVNISQFDTQNGALTLTGLDTTVTFFQRVAGALLARFRADRPPHQPHVCRANPEPVFWAKGALARKRHHLGPSLRRNPLPVIERRSPIVGYRTCRSATVVLNILNGPRGARARG